MNEKIVVKSPGSKIREELSGRGMSQKEFALRMGLTEKHVSKLINEEVQLTVDVSVRLETVLGIPASDWNAMEASYRESLLREAQAEGKEAEAELAQCFPYAEMAKLGWVPEAKNLKERVCHLREFFGVVDLALLDQWQVTRIAVHALSLEQPEDLTIMAWAQEARRRAWQVPAPSLNVKDFDEWVPELLKWTVERPAAFLPKLREALERHGMILVLLPRLRGLSLQSCTFPAGNRIVIALTEKRMDDNEFWFRLFHELGHVFLEHVWQKDGTAEQDERDANLWARNALLPRKTFDAFRQGGSYTEKSVLEFAGQQGIAPGILVGRMQYEGLIGGGALNRLKRVYEFRGGRP